VLIPQVPSVPHRMRLFFPVKSGLRPVRPSSRTRHGWFRVASIDQYSLLLPPVGVGSVLSTRVGVRALTPPTHRWLGAPLPHQLPNEPHIHLPPDCSFHCLPMPGHKLMRDYSPFPATFPLPKVGYVRVTHPFATRRLNALPFDLHVLGLPLAFILSQDQTLRCTCSVIDGALIQIFTWLTLSCLLHIQSTASFGKFVSPGCARLFGRGCKGTATFLISKFFEKNFSTFFRPRCLRRSSSRTGLQKYDSFDKLQIFREKFFIYFFRRFLNSVCLSERDCKGRKVLGASKFFRIYFEKKFGCRCFLCFCPLSV